MPDWLLRVTEAESRRIEAILRAHRPKPAAGTLAAWKVQLANLLHPAPDRGGAIESVEIQGGFAVIRGWALTPRRGGAESFAVAVDRRPAEVTGLIRTRRSDLLLRFPDASAECGFNLRIAWPIPTESSRTPVPVTVTARYSGEKSFALPASPETDWRLLDAAEQPPTPPKPAAFPRASIPDRPRIPPEAGSGS
jgi:hypothetical protein